MDIEDAAQELRERKHAEAVQRYTSPPWWMHTRFNGRLYRPIMRIVHRLGFCYPTPVFPEGDIVWWCTWCGLRGHK